MSLPYNHSSTHPQFGCYSELDPRKEGMSALAPQQRELQEWNSIHNGSKILLQKNATKPSIGHTMAPPYPYLHTYLSILLTLSYFNMGKLSTLSLSALSLLLFATACFAVSSTRFNECQLDNLNPLEPDHTVETEGGSIKTWNSQHPELQCAGFTVSKRTLNRNGLHLPSYSPYPQAIMVTQGKGAIGYALPGCPDTFEEAQQQSGSSSKGQQTQDSHQKIRHINEGDFLVIPPGVPYWTYNTGKEPLVAISLLDTSNLNNQLDESPRVFYLVGNPDIEHPETMKQDKEEGGSVLSGFSKHFLAQSYCTSEDIAEKLQSPKDERKQIVTVEGGLSVISPRWKEQQEDEDEDEDESSSHHQEQSSHGKHEEDKDEDKSPHSRNGIEENICTLKLHENIARPSRADFYNPKAGRISTLNSLTLPVLRQVGLSAQYVVLYKNGIYAPHWNLNANSVIYVTRGKGKVTVVNCQGKAVFDGELKRGQLLVVPQNFVVAEQAGEQGFEYVVFKTHHNAMSSYLKDVFRAIPAEVLANSYNLRQSQVQELKSEGTWGPLVNPEDCEQSSHLA